LSDGDGGDGGSLLHDDAGEPPRRRSGRASFAAQAPVASGELMRRLRRVQGEGEEAAAQRGRGGGDARGATLRASRRAWPPGGGGRA
jgi:hypothetical protein